MKKLLFAFFLLIGFTHVFAADGYKVQVKFTDQKEVPVYLAHYYGKPLPTIFKADSAMLDKDGTIVFTNPDKIVGGIYIIMFDDSKDYFEFLLQNGDDMVITATKSKLPNGVKFKNSPNNDRFLEYLASLKDYSNAQQSAPADLAKAKTKADTNLVISKITVSGQKVRDYRISYVNKYPGSLLANIFLGMESPQVPQGKHYLPNGKEDSSFAYNYYKSHYWDKFDLTDNRLIYTPLYESKLEYYFNNLVDPVADSMQKEGAKLLEKTRGHKEVFKYTLWWLTQNVQNSNIMGMDQAFVYFIENYYMKGDADWLTPEVLSEYADRARKIAPNVIGNIGADIKMVDINKKPVTLYGMEAKYSLLVFWSPECGGCRTQMPLIDSIYRSVLKDKGVKIFAVRTDGDEAMWKDFIAKKKLNDWLHVYDPEHKSNYRTKYDVYGTPVIYLLDEKKIIRGKKLDYTNIAAVLEMLEEKENTTKKKS